MTTETLDDVKLSSEDESRYQGLLILSPRFTDLTRAQFCGWDERQTLAKLSVECTNDWMRFMRQAYDDALSRRIADLCEGKAA